ncbi:MAG: hypothetical protein M5U19_11005 [Microthrixaceae bacterium]|nr:hypothetical protein [Microthrixaceae bacterium]
MAEWGLTSAKAAQVSTLETRAAKVVSPERTPDQQARWRSEALTIGVSTADLAVVMADHQVPSIDADETTALFNRLSSSSGLTETYSTFDRRDVLRRVIDELPAAVPVEVIESLGSQYLQRLEVVAVGWEERTGTSFSTIELMALEQDLVRARPRWGGCRSCRRVAGRPRISLRCSTIGQPRAGTRRHRDLQFRPFGRRARRRRRDRQDVQPRCGTRGLAAHQLPGRRLRPGRIRSA